MRGRVQERCTRSRFLVALRLLTFSELLGNDIVALRDTLVTDVHAGTRFRSRPTIARGWRSEQACPAVSEERLAACGSEARRSAAHRSGFPPAAREVTMSPP